MSVGVINVAFLYIINDLGKTETVGNCDKKVDFFFLKILSVMKDMSLILTGFLTTVSSCIHCSLELEKCGLQILRIKLEQP